jgi:hypothetical protein
VPKPPRSAWGVDFGGGRMIRATVISSIREYLQTTYEGPVAIHSETSTETMQPPYAVVRVGSGEELYPGQAEIWDLNILIGVFQDADSTTAETAETNAAEVFAAISDPEPLFASSDDLAWSVLERSGTEASVVENRWQHVAAYRAIVAPAADD